MVPSDFLTHYPTLICAYCRFNRATRPGEGQSNYRQDDLSISHMGKLFSLEELSKYESILTLFIHFSILMSIQVLECTNPLHGAFPHCMRDRGTKHNPRLNVGPNMIVHMSTPRQADTSGSFLERTAKDKSHEAWFNRRSVLIRMR